MKVLRINNNLFMGGVERSLETNVPIHIKNGIDTDILLLNGTITDFYKSLIEKHVKIFHLGKGSLYNPLLIFKMMPYLNNYDIIHVHSFPAQYWIVIAKLLSGSKTPIIFSEHSTSNNRRKYKIFKYIDRWFYKHYQHIISISEATTINLKKEIGDDFKITTIPNGVYLEPYLKTYKKIEFVDESNVIILTQIANFRYPKDQETTIKSLQLLPQNVHLVLVGDGDNIDYCKNLANSLGVNLRVHFLGKRNDIPNIVYSSDIIVMSSIYEGFGRAAVEGMAGRKPVVASNVPGLREVVNHAGLLFEAQNEAQLADCIKKLLDSRIYYNEVAELCYQRAKEYDVSHMVKGYEDIYKEVFNRNTKKIK